MVAIPGRGYIVVDEKYPSRYGASAGAQLTVQPLEVGTQPAVAGAPESMWLGTQAGLWGVAFGGVVAAGGTGAGVFSPAAALGPADLAGAALDGVDVAELGRGVDAAIPDAFAVSAQPARTTTTIGRSANRAVVEKACRKRNPLRRVDRFPMNGT